MFGLENIKDKDSGKRANLAFGPPPGKGGSFIVARNPATPNAAVGRRVVDHICFTLSNWDEEKVRGAMKAKGKEISGGRDGSLHVLDPFDYDVQFANIVEEDAFRRGQVGSDAMEGFVAQKLNDFETGKISRRRLIETLTFAATTVYAADSATAQSREPAQGPTDQPHFVHLSRLQEGRGLVFEGVQPRSGRPDPARRRAAVRQEG